MSLLSSTIYDTIINKRIDLQFGIGYDEYCKTITQSSDEAIIEHYMHFSPDYAIPVLRKGTPFSLALKLHSIELEYGRINALIDDLNFIHFGGPFFCEPGNPINRYCYCCMFNNISDKCYEVATYYQHKMFFNDLIAAEEIFLCANQHKYWCTICNCFLFTVLSSDTNYCMECEPCIKYDSNTNIPIQFFPDDIDYYFRVHTTLYFDEE